MIPRNFPEIKEQKAYQKKIRTIAKQCNMKVKFEKEFPLRYDWFVNYRACVGHRYFEDGCCCPVKS